METLAGCLNASQEPLEQAVSLWNAARNLMKRSDLVHTDENVAKALFFVAQWRCHAAQTRAEVRTSAFVATCALRLAVLDAARNHEAVKAFLRLRVEATPARQVAEVARGECEAFKQFRVPKNQAETLKKVRQASYAWHDRFFEDWSEVAYATCFVLEGGDAQEVAIDESFLTACANFDAECVYRTQLRAKLLGEGMVCSKPDDPRAETAARWLRRSVTNANDDVMALGREAFVWTYLTPAVARRGMESSPSLKLTAWDPLRGADAHKAAKGFQDWDTLSDPLVRSALFLYFFDYTMRQFCDISFLKMFFCDDYNGDLTMSHIEAFKTDRLKNPPPLVVYSMRQWHVVFRSAEAGAAIDRVEVYPSSWSAILAWLDYVMSVRMGVVFMGKRINKIFFDMTIEHVTEARVLTAATETL